MQILNKITMKAVCGCEVKEALGTEPQLDLILLIGIAKKKEIFKSTFGGQVKDSWKLLGEFKARNILTKEEFYAPIAFLPDIAADIWAMQMDDTDQNATQFACILGAKATKATIGYEYTCKPLVKPAENTALAMLEKTVTAALPAPETLRTLNPGGITDPKDLSL